MNPEDPTGDGDSEEVAGKSVRVSIRDQLMAFRRPTQSPTTSSNKLTKITQKVVPKLHQPDPAVTVVENIVQTPPASDDDLSRKMGDDVQTPDSSTGSPFTPSQELVASWSGLQIQIGEDVAVIADGSDKSQSSPQSQPIEATEKTRENVIRAIDRGVVHQICSGQVIVTLSTAVKELVENSLDAGATKIDIKLQEYGSKLIEVTDDGYGIEENNFEGLALKHHTSKISDFEDLTGVTTFGFRGEALSSLCALSKLTVITRHKSSDEKLGFKLEYDYNGKIVSRTRSARGIGTTVILKDLFHTLPVRHREFMKNLKREFHRMVNILYGYCLVVNGTRISCTNQVGNSGLTKVIGVPSYNSIKERIVALFGSKQLSSLLEIKQSDTVPDEILSEFGLTDKTFDKKYQVEGYISKPNHGRSSNDRQFFFINSRPCDPVKISRVINEVYHSFSRHQNPFVCLHITTKREDVDVNVTPDKRTLYLQNEKNLLATIKASLIPLLTAAASQFDSSSSQVSTQLKLTFDSSQTEDDADTSSLIPSSSFSIRMEADADPESQTSLSQDGFDKQYSQSSSKKLPSAVVARTNSFLKSLSLRKEATSSFKRQRDGSSFSRDIPKEPKLTSYLTRYERSEKESLSPRKRTRVMEQTDDLDLESEDVTDHETREEDEADMEVIYDDNSQDDSQVEDDSGCLNRKVIKISVDWQEVTSKLASMKVKGESGNPTLNYARRFRAKIAPEDNSAAEDELKKQITQDMFCKMEILGQFNLGFIIVKNGPDLFIVDQHASDEKFNFEDLEKTMVLQGQLLLRPLDLELPAISENIIMDNIEAFQKNGFDFIISPEAEPTKRVKLSKIPYSKNTEFGKADIEELVFMMEEASEKSFYRPTKVRDMLASRACRKSVMIGTALNPKEMRAILNHMGDMSQPWNCPHGRPTIRHLINLNLLPDIDYGTFSH